MPIKETLSTLTNAELIQLFKDVRDQLNLKTITEFSHANKIAYNTAKTKQPFVMVGKTKYLPDNGRH